jgi:hypothetical protein
MSRQSPLVGQFFLSADGRTLYKIAADITSGAYFLVESFTGLLPEPDSKSVWPVGKITGFKLYPSVEAAQAASQKAAK